MKSTVVLTFTYPSVKEYFDEFLKSMNAQIERNFDLIIVNDGLNEVADIVRDFPLLDISIFNCEKTPAKNREFGLRLVKKKGYKYCILADSDDCFSENRVADSVKCLQNSDIVVNDLTISNSEGTILVEKYFSKRLVDGYIIPCEFLREKNILGFSNTAFKTELIDSDIIIPEDLTIVDWYFYTLLLNKGCKATFTSNSITYYRQSDNNIIGINNVSEEKYMRRYMLKREHYLYLSRVMPGFDDLLLQYGESEESYKRQFCKFINSHIENPFWWEEI